MVLAHDGVHGCPGVDEVGHDGRRASPPVVEGRHVAGVRDEHERRVREERRGGRALRRRCERVEVAGEHQRRDVGEAGVRARGRIVVVGAPATSRTRSSSLAVDACHSSGVQGANVAGCSRCLSARRAASIAAQPFGGRRGGVEDRRVVRAGRRDADAGRVDGERVVADEHGVVGEQAQQRSLVTRQPRGRSGIELAVHGPVGRRRQHATTARLTASAVTSTVSPSASVTSACDRRSAAPTRRERRSGSDVGSSLAAHVASRSHTRSNAMSAAGMRSAWNGSAPTTGRALSSTRLRELVAVAGRERLRDDRAVRVPVEVDVPGAECVHHRGEVVGGRRRAVLVAGSAQRAPRSRSTAAIVGSPLLERGAVERSRPARASRVDEKEVVVVENGLEEGEVGVACPGGRVAGPTLDRDDRARRRLRGASRRG